MTIPEVLQWMNVVLVPLLVYVVRLSNRLIRLEVLLAVHLGVDLEKINKIAGA